MVKENCGQNLSIRQQESGERNRYNQKDQEEWNQRKGNGTSITKGKWISMGRR